MNERITITGKEIRARLKALGILKNYERTCCGGKKMHSRDYTQQLRRLGMHGHFTVTENGVIVDFVDLL